ncbi:hypothetical protein FRX31_016386 [Thalictrum thalictroides]|uniref:Uncharacterized protein n=1 Tax=Thalictrum thalictroides TaxID=46969 RepID=A0A7J6WAN8_THATH|nr:hypothetical protein FRX31_016386 [Thalictrum thalictroides]
MLEHNPSFLFLVANVSVGAGSMVLNICSTQNNGWVEKNFRDIDSFIDEVVEEHIEKKRSRIDGHGSGDNEEEDFVDVMLGMENSERKHGISWARDTTKAIVLLKRS